MCIGFKANTNYFLPHLIPGPVVVSIEDDVAVSRVEPPMVLLGHLQQVEVVHPEDLLGALAVVNHAALGGNGGLFVQGARVELGLHHLSDATAGCGKWLVRKETLDLRSGTIELRVGAVEAAATKPGRAAAIEVATAAGTTTGIYNSSSTSSSLIIDSSNSSSSNNSRISSIIISSSSSNRNNL